jgi:hypothetical protein
MSQLVGSRCALCGQVIGSVLEGKFCPDCDSPYHDKCRAGLGEAIPGARLSADDSTRCPTCGGDISALQAARAERERQAAAAMARGPATRVLTAIFCLEVIALAELAAAGWIYFSAPASGREVVVYVDGILLGVVALIQVVVFGLSRGHSWARAAGIALFILSVPSLAFPFAFLGLAMLLNGQAWAAYRERRWPRVLTPPAAGDGNSLNQTEEGLEPKNHR